MTVSTQTSRADYTGNGATTAFTVPFYFLDNSHVQIIRTQISTGVATTLALTTDYTLSGAGVNAGGTATMLVAPTADQRLTILRSVPFTQLTQYVPNDPFPAASHERALDQLTMEVQQLYENISRALTLSANSSGVSAALPSAQATTLIGWNNAGTALQNYDAALLGVSIAYSAWRSDNFSGNGSQTAFVLSADAATASNCDVAVGGVSQTPGINYSYNAVTKTLTFLTGAPPAGTNNIYVRYGQPLALGTIASISITDSTAFGRSVLTAASASAAGLQASLGYTAADDTAVVKLTGNQTIAGTKTFSSQPVLPQATTFATAVATTSGTAIDFTSIPSWVNEIDVLMNAVSTSGAGSAALLVQIGSGSVQTTGYLSYAGTYTNANQTSTAASTAGLLVTTAQGAASTHSGILSLKRISGNTWVASGSGGGLDGASTNTARNSGGTVTLGGTLDRLRFTTTNGTDAFDGGSVNIVYR